MADGGMQIVKRIYNLAVSPKRGILRSGGALIQDTRTRTKKRAPEVRRVPGLLCTLAGAGFDETPQTFEFCEL